MTGSDSEPFLAFRDVSKVYASKKGDVHAVDHVSLDIGRGQFVSIVGPSGCGKSTLLNMLAGIIPLSGGQILLEGSPENPGGEAGFLGMVFQTPVLLDWRDVLSNVLLPIEILGRNSKEGLERAEALLEMVGLAEFDNRYPVELSGGMQQRVAICRALVFDPPVLLMDEPFGALDALTRDEMAIELLKIWDATKKTILFVTHSIEEAVLLSDKVMVMSPRPGTVQLEVDIDLSRPRSMATRYEPEFVHYRELLADTIFGNKDR